MAGQQQFYNRGNGNIFIWQTVTTLRVTQRRGGEGLIQQDHHKFNHSFNYKRRIVNTLHFYDYILPIKLFGLQIYLFTDTLSNKINTVHACVWLIATD